MASNLLFSFGIPRRITFDPAAIYAEGSMENILITELYTIYKNYPESVKSPNEFDLVDIAYPATEISPRGGNDI